MKLIRMTLILGFMAVTLSLGSSNSQQRSDSLRLLLDGSSDLNVRASALKQLSRISFENVGVCFSHSVSQSGIKRSPLKTGTLYPGPMLSIAWEWFTV
ncbi:MAG: hypothetical protein IPH20_21670 [Bacteroidales bacterium]|nr:hypothetical protein [Bacteroidales bacterium]